MQSTEETFNYHEALQLVKKIITSPSLHPELNFSDLYFGNKHSEDLKNLSSKRLFLYDNEALNEKHPKFVTDGYFVLISKEHFIENLFKPIQEYLESNKNENSRNDFNLKLLQFFKPIFSATSGNNEVPEAVSREEFKKIIQNVSPDSAEKMFSDEPHIVKLLNLYSDYVKDNSNTSFFTAYEKYFYNDIEYVKEKLNNPALEAINLNDKFSKKGSFLVEADDLLVAYFNKKIVEQAVKNYQSASNAEEADIKNVVLAPLAKYLNSIDYSYVSDAVDNIKRVLAQNNIGAEKTNETSQPKVLAFETKSIFADLFTNYKTCTREAVELFVASITDADKYTLTFENKISKHIFKNSSEQKPKLKM